MIRLVLMLLMLAGNVATLPSTERATGALAAVGALVTGFLLACTEAGFAMAPDGWLFDITVALTVLNCLLGRNHEPDGQVHSSQSEVR